MKRIITKIYCKESINKFCKCVYITSKDEEGNNEENRVFFESVEVDESKLQSYVGKSEELAFDDLYGSDFKELIRALKKLYESDAVTTEEKGEKFFDTNEKNLADYCERLACGELINCDGSCNLSGIAALRNNGYLVYAGEKDSFGWLTGCIQKDGDNRILIYG